MNENKPVPKNKISTELVFTILCCSYWSFYAAFINYAATFFLESGISSSRVSVLISSYLLMAFFGAFIWGEISDRLGTNKKTLVAQASLCLLFCVLIFCFVGNRRLLTILYPLLGLIVIPMSGNIDAWVLHSFQNDQAKYGKIRSKGSYVFAVMALIFGWLIRGIGFSMMLCGAVLFLGLVISASLYIPEVSGDIRIENKGFSFADIGALFSSASYRRMILIIFLIGMAIMPANNLKILIIENVHGDVSNLGIDAFLGVMVQAPLIALTAGMKSLSVRQKLLLQAIAQFGMLLIFALARNVWLVYLGTCCTNIGYGILLPTMRQIVEKHVDSHLRNLGHNVADAVYASLSGVLSTAIAGRGSELLGVRNMMAVFAAFMLIPLVMCAADVIREKRPGGRTA